MFLNKDKDKIEKKYISSEENKLKLQSFIKHYSIKLTDKGELILYKAVRGNMTSKFNPNFKYEVGKYVTEKLDESPNVNCSRGIHVSTIKYAYDFGNSVDNQYYILNKKININEYHNYSDILFSENIDLLEKQSNDLILKLIVNKDDIIVPKKNDGKVRCRKAFVHSVMPEHTFNSNPFKHETNIYTKDDFHTSHKIYFEINFNNILYKSYFEHGYDYMLQMYSFRHHVYFANIEDITEESIKWEINKLITDLHDKYKILDMIENCKFKLYKKE